GDARPDLLVVDDLEPGEASYSAGLAAKRLTTLLDDILPLNVYARVAMVGTTVMQGSIVDQLRTGREAWVSTERFKVTTTPAIATGDDGTRRSIWPEKWPLPFLESIEHTRQYAKNYGLSPLGADGDYWGPGDFARRPIGALTHLLVSVDPAVTSRRSSDYTGIALLGWDAAARLVTVLGCWQVKLAPDELRLRVLRVLDEALERWNRPALVLVEVNQGGDLWPRIFHSMPVRVKTVHQSQSKEIRAADALAHYQRGRVVHAEGVALTEAEGQMVAFPNAAHDDMVDAIGSGVRYFLTRKAKAQPAGATAVGYAS
ncbi:MAG: hypothetical protein ACRCSN_08445, partial [Dermatophilaceae bacterium]